MGARTGGRRIGQLSSQAQPDKATAFRRWRRAIERHLTQKGSVRKRATAQPDGGTRHSREYFARRPVATALCSRGNAKFGHCVRCEPQAASSSGAVSRQSSRARMLQSQNSEPGHWKCLEAQCQPGSGERRSIPTSRDPHRCGVAIFGRRRTPCAPHCTGLVIVPIFAGRVLASYTPLADLPAGPLLRAFAAPVDSRGTLVALLGPPKSV